VINQGGDTLNELRSTAVGPFHRAQTSRRTLLKGVGAIGMLGGLGRLSLPGALAQDAATPQPVRGGSITAGITGQPDNLDPATNVGYAGVQVYDNVFNKLVDIDRSGTVVPQLATAWKQIDDNVWEFNLVENAVFHNGEKFTADDVRFTFERIKAPATASSFAPLFAPVTAVDAVSDFTVRFTLEKPYGPFLSSLAARGQIVNEKAVTDLDPKRNPVGTGPFRFIEWVTDDHLTLERWDQYYASGKPYLDQLIFRGLPVDQTRMAALQAGEVQWVDAVPLNMIPELESSSDLQYLTSANAGLPDYLALNTTKPPFDNAKLRQAVAWAIDRSTILQLAYSGIGEVANEAVSTGSAWYTGVDPYASAPDLDKAKQLLAESGYDAGKTIEMLSLPQYPELQRTAEIVKDQLGKIGLNVDLKQVEVTVWLDQFINKGYQITTAYQQGILDPDDFYYLTLHSAEPRNFTGYANPAADTPLELARFTTDQGQRKQLYADALQIILTDAPVIFTHYELVNYAFQPSVHGVTILPSMDLRFEDVWIDQ
jgi:peptide/nickel transport system substrate-binding protein